MRHLVMVSLVAFVAFSMAATSLYAQLPPPPAQQPWFRVLLPIYMEHPVSGAFGSMWESTLAMYNHAAESYSIEWCPYNEVCTLDLRDDEVLEPGETQTILPGRYPKPQGGNAGAVVYMTVFNPALLDGSGLSFQLRVHDLSRDALSAGTEIPVIRESQFRRDTIHLLSIPVDPRFRIMLRLYEMNLDQADFVVRTYDEATGTKLDERLVTLQTPPQGTSRYQPGYAQIGDIVSRIGQIPPSTLRVEIEPLTPLSESWAFISLTNNATQELTLITPQ